MIKRAHGKVRALAPACALALLVAMDGSQAQMKTPGQFAVSPTGAGTYSIPIQVPPGIAGMEPKLALVYNSQMGNGLLGVGWSLSGLSVITRCPQTKSQDGVNQPGAIQFTASDRFCMDGKRLVNVPAPIQSGVSTGTVGVYGADQTYYSTEREEFSRVQSIGAVSSGPSSFKVWAKSGLIYEYGNTADSKIFASDGVKSKGAVRVWALNKVTDAKGNYMTITYSQPDLVTGQYYPARIDYTANAAPGGAAAVGSLNYVLFNYQLNGAGKPTRTDVSSAYSGGAVVTGTALMSSIVTYSGTSGIKSYAMTYENSPGTYRSRLTQIQECNQSKSNCLPATTFNWDNQSSSQLTFSRAETQAGAIWPNLDWWYVGDANGDGLPDIYHIFNNNGSISIDVHVNNGNGTLSASRWATNVGALSGGGTDQFFVIDVDGDGRADVVHLYYDSGNTVSIDFILNKPGTLLQNLKRAETKAGSFFIVQNNQLSLFSQWYIGDANGDGLPDFYHIFADSSGNNTIDIDVHLNNGDGTLSMARWATNVGGLPGSDQFFIADVDGDGRTDVVHLFNDNGYASVDFIMSKPGTLLQNLYRAETQAGGFVFTTSLWYVGDANGDGLPDLFHIFNDNGTIDVDVHVNNGAGGLLMSRWATNVGGFPGNDQFFVADVNGDGKSDVIHLFNDYGYASVDFMVSDGSSLHAYRAQTQSGSMSSSQHWDKIDAYGTGSVGLFNLYADNNLATVDFHGVSTLSGDRVVNIGSAGFPGKMGTIVNMGYQPLPQATLKGRYSTNYSLNKFPTEIISEPISVLLDADVGDGLGGLRRTSYWYDSAAVEVSTGRGFLGFQFMQSQDVSSGITTRTTYRQDFPFTGQVAATTQGTGPSTANNLGQTAYQYACIDFSSASATASALCSAVAQSCTIAPGKRYYVYPNVIDSTGNKDLTAAGQPGKGLPGSHTTQVQDNWGNALCSAVQTQDWTGSNTDFSKTITNVYAPADVTNWYLGRLLRSTTTATAH